MGRLIGMASMLRRAAVLGILLSTLVIVGGAGTASACSCASADPVAAAASADVVFTGSLVGHEGGDSEPVWTFAVDGWVKGDLPAAEIVVQGQDYGGGCGVPFAWVASPVAVFADRKGDELISIACSPTPGRAAFATALEQAAAIEASGTGSPAALVVGRSGAANLRVLDEAGELLLQTNLEPEPSAGAHCPGTSLAAFWSHGRAVDSGVGSTSNVVSIVDLDTLEVVESRRLESQWVSSRDDIVCVDAGDRVIVGRGFGPNDGTVTAATSNGDASLNVSRDYVGVSRALVHPSGTITLLPSAAGGGLRTLSSDDLEPLVEFELDASVAATHGAFSPDGSTLALLVTDSGDEMGYDTNATHVLTFDVVNGAVVEGSGVLVELAAGERGRAKWIEWFDASTWAIERETDSSKIIEVYSNDGARVSSTDVGWGWGLLSFDSQILRARDGGVELIDRSGVSTELTPMPAGPNNFSDLALASIADAPLWGPAERPGVEALLLRDIDAIESAVPDADQGVVEPPSSDVEASLDESRDSQPASPATPTPVEENGFAWPVLIVGGLIIVAGLVATRGEFRNWRRRRAERD